MLGDPTSNSLRQEKSPLDAVHFIEKGNGKTEQVSESTSTVPNHVLMTNLFSVSKTSRFEPTPTENQTNIAFTSTSPTVSQMYKPTLQSQATIRERLYIPTEKVQEPESEAVTPTVSQMFKPTVFSNPTSSETPFAPTETDEDSDDEPSSPTVSHLWQPSSLLQSTPSDNPPSVEEDVISQDRMFELEKFSKQMQSKEKKRSKKKRLVPHAAPSYTPNRMPRNKTFVGIPREDQVKGAFSTKQRSSVSVYWTPRYTHPIAWKKKIYKMNSLMSIDLSNKQLPDNHTMVVLTAGGYVGFVFSLF